MGKSGWHLRGLTSLVSAASFVIMTVTGVVAYLMPEGRVAYWTDWRLAGLSKVAWGNLHTLSSFVFVAAACFHLYFNWKPFVAYLYSKARRAMTLRRELAVTALVSLLTVAGSVWPFPPLTWVFTLGEHLKSSWVVAPEYEPPYGHAETSSLKVLARRTGIDLDKALAELAGEGVTVTDPAMKLGDVAAANGTTPMALYAIMRRHEIPEEDQAPGAWTAESVEEKFTGTGVGNRTLAVMAGETGLDLAAARRRLADNGMTMDEGETFKKAAGRYGVQPIDLLTVVLVEGHRIR